MENNNRITDNQIETPETFEEKVITLITEKLKGKTTITAEYIDELLEFLAAKKIPCEIDNIVDICSQNEIEIIGEGRIVENILR